MSRITFQKRQKEMKRREKQRMKQEKRAERKRAQNDPAAEPAVDAQPVGEEVPMNEVTATEIPQDA